MQARDELFGDGSALEGPAQDDIAISGRDLRKSQTSCSCDMWNSRPSEQAANGRSGVRNNNGSDSLYSWLRGWWFEKLGDVNGERINTRRPGPE